MFKVPKKVATPILIGLLISGLLSLLPYAKAWDDSQKVYYLLNDHLGNIDKVLDEDGNVVEEYDYRPYGEMRIHNLVNGTDEIDYGYAGKELDTEEDLIYFGARYYDPLTGRFITQDPVLLDKAQKSRETLNTYLASPQKLNAYSYALNNPITFTDLFGESPFTERWKGVGEMIDGALMYGIATGLTGTTPYLQNKIGAIAVKNLGVIKGGLGVTKAASGKEIKFKENFNEAKQYIEKIPAAILVGTDPVIRVVKWAINRPGYGKSFEAIAYMVENKVTYQEFKNSIKPALKDLLKDGKGWYNGTKEFLSGIVTRKKESNNRKNDEN